MTIFARTAFLAAKKEATEGTAETLVAADAIEIEDLALTVQSNRIERNINRPAPGARPSVLVGRWAELTFGVAFAGSGTNNVAAPWTKLLEMAGFGAPVVGGDNVTQSLIKPQDVPSGTFRFDIDNGQIHELVGARANVAFDLSPGAVPLMNFTVRGLYVDPVRGTALVPDYSAFQTPVAPTEATVPTFQLHGRDLVMSQFTLDMGGQVNYRNVVNDESVKYADRNPQGQCTFDAESIADKDWFASSMNDLTGTLVYEIGTVAGRIVRLDAPVVQVFIDGQQQYQADESGIATFTAGMLFLPGSGAGNDELVVTTK